MYIAKLILFGWASSSMFLGFSFREYTVAKIEGCLPQVNFVWF